MSSLIVMKRVGREGIGVVVDWWRRETWCGRSMLRWLEEDGLARGRAVVMMDEGLEWEERECSKSGFLM